MEDLSLWSFLRLLFVTDFLFGTSFSFVKVDYEKIQFPYVYLNFPESWMLHLDQTSALSDLHKKEVHLFYYLQQQVCLIGKKWTFMLSTLTQCAFAFQKLLYWLEEFVFDFTGSLGKEPTGIRICCWRVGWA